MRIAPLVALMLIAAPPAGAQMMHEHHHPDTSLTRVRLVETAQRTVRQDRLRAILRAEVTGPDARRVQAEINRRMTAAVERAKAAASIKVETGSYSLSLDRRYLHNGPADWTGQADRRGHVRDSRAWGSCRWDRNCADHLPGFHRLPYRHVERA